MRPLTLAQRSQIISLLDTHHSGKEISRRMGVSTGAISKVRSEHQSSLPKSTGGRPSKLSSADIAYAKRIIRMRKADNAKQVMKVLKKCHQPDSVFSNCLSPFENIWFEASGEEKVTIS